MKNHYNLHCPVNFLRSDINNQDYPEFENYHWGVWNDRSEKYLTPEAIEFIHNEFKFVEQVWFNEKLQKSHVAVFRGNQDTIMDIHCDSGLTWCINLVWGTTDSEMLWWAPNGEVRMTEEMCSVGSPYKKYDPTSMRVIDRTSSMGPTLMRIDTPHNVINRDSENYRWCLSIRDISSRWSWEEAVDYFSPWIAK